MGLIDRPDALGVVRTHDRPADDPTRGIATSGCHGRSFSLGIADAVTVLARTAAQADAAATIIANAVDLPDHPAIIRARRSDLQPDSDLGAAWSRAMSAPCRPPRSTIALDAGDAEARGLLGRD